jgi:hypothetical protein
MPVSSSACPAAPHSPPVRPRFTPQVTTENIHPCTVNNTLYHPQIFRPAFSPKALKPPNLLHTLSHPPTSCTPQLNSNRSPQVPSANHSPLKSLHFIHLPSHAPIIHPASLSKSFPPELALTTCPIPESFTPQSSQISVGGCLVHSAHKKQKKHTYKYTTTFSQHTAPDSLLHSILRHTIGVPHSNFTTPLVPHSNFTIPLVYRIPTSSKRHFTAFLLLHIMNVLCRTTVLRSAATKPHLGPPAPTSPHWAAHISETWRFWRNSAKIRRVAQI